MKAIIKNYIGQQACATISCIDQPDVPYCFSCFYVFNENEVLLYFKSSDNSHHSGLLKKNPRIAGTILPDNLNPILIKGIQFEGTIIDPDDEMTQEASRRYYKKYPVAHIMSGELWIIRIDHIKMTHNTTGFINHVSWNRESNVLH